MTSFFYIWGSFQYATSPNSSLVPFYTTSRNLQAREVGPEGQLIHSPPGSAIETDMRRAKPSCLRVASTRRRVRKDPSRCDCIRKKSLGSVLGSTSSFTAGQGAFKVNRGGRGGVPDEKICRSSRSGWCRMLGTRQLTKALPKGTKPRLTEDRGASQHTHFLPRGTGMWF